MARPTARTIVSVEYRDIEIDILEAQGQYTVLYKDQPFNIRQRYWEINGEINKYIRTSYASLSPAERLADKLNTAFNTQDFQVKKIL